MVGLLSFLCVSFFGRFVGNSRGNVFYLKGHASHRLYADRVRVATTARSFRSWLCVSLVCKAKTSMCFPYMFYRRGEYLSSCGVRRLVYYLHTSGHQAFRVLAQASEGYGYATMCFHVARYLHANFVTYRVVSRRFARANRFYPKASRMYYHLGYASAYFYRGIVNVGRGAYVGAIDLYQERLRSLLRMLWGFYCRLANEEHVQLGVKRGQVFGRFTTLTIVVGRGSHVYAHRRFQTLHVA